jgi:hypothetical protein
VGAGVEMSREPCGRGKKESRQERDLKRLKEELIAAFGVADEGLENQGHGRRLVRNLAWLVAPFCSLVLLLVTLKWLPPWIRYPLAVVGSIPITVVAVCISLLLADICIRTMSRQRRSE